MRNPNRETIFRFKQFEVANCLSAMKVGTDGVLLGAWAAKDFITKEPKNQTSPRETLRILDIGAGTGLISLMLAQRFRNAEIFGVEIDADAANEACRNFRNSPWPDRLHVIEGDILQTAETFPEKFDIIVSNPPFFSNGVVAQDSSRRQARHESSLSLESLIATAAKLLSDDGVLCIIMPADREKEVKFNAVVNKLSVSRLTRITTVAGKAPRRILAEMTLAKPTPCIESELSIREASNDFSTEYSDLVKDFYLNF